MKRHAVAKTAPALVVAALFAGSAGGQMPVIDTPDLLRRIADSVDHGLEHVELIGKIHH